MGRHAQAEAWRCQELDDYGNECDFDLCQDCLRWVLYCEHTGTIMGTVINEDDGSP